MANPEEKPTKSEQLKASYSALFRSAEGEKVLDDLVQFAGLCKSVPSLDLQTLAYYEGMKRVALHILGMLHENPLDTHKRQYGRSSDE